MRFDPCALAIVLCAASGCRREAAWTPEAGTAAPDAAATDMRDAAPETYIDVGRLFDRAAFCSAIAAETKSSWSKLSRLAAQASDNPELLQSARPRYTAAVGLGSCVGSREGAWGLTLERLGPTERDMVYGTFGLVHGLPDGKDVRLRPWPLDKTPGSAFANFGLHAESICYQAPRVMGSFDWDGDGDEEIVLAVESSGHETWEFDSAVFSFKNGAVVPYAPAADLVIDEVRDVDRDGRPDLLTSGPYSDVTADLGAGFAATRLVEKMFVAHSLADGRFSLDDSVAARAVAKWCPRSPLDDEPDASADDDLEAARKRHVTSILCARIRGRSAASVAADIRRGCAPADASRTQPYCSDKDMLLKWVAKAPPLRLP